MQKTVKPSVPLASIIYQISFLINVSHYIVNSFLSRIRVVIWKSRVVIRPIEQTTRRGLVWTIKDKPWLSPGSVCWILHRGRPIPVLPAKPFMQITIRGRIPDILWKSIWSSDQLLCPVVLLDKLGEIGTWGFACRLIDQSTLTNPWSIWWYNSKCSVWRYLR